MDLKAAEIERELEKLLGLSLKVEMVEGRVPARTDGEKLMVGNDYARSEAVISCLAAGAMIRAVDLNELEEVMSLRPLSEAGVKLLHMFLDTRATEYLKGLSKELYRRYMVFTRADLRGEVDADLLFFQALKYETLTERRATFITDERIVEALKEGFRFREIIKRGSAYELVEAAGRLGDLEIIEEVLG